MSCDNYVKVFTFKWVCIVVFLIHAAECTCNQKYSSNCQIVYYKLQVARGVFLFLSQRWFQIQKKAPPETRNEECPPRVWLIFCEMLRSIFFPYNVSRKFGFLLLQGEINLTTRLILTYYQYKTWQLAVVLDKNKRRLLLFRHSHMLDLWRKVNSCSEKWQISTQRLLFDTLQGNSSIFYVFFYNVISCMRSLRFLVVVDPLCKERNTKIISAKPVLYQNQ